MGERPSDRIDLLYELAVQDPQPESVPINTLVAVEGTPLANQEPVVWEELVRMVAVARILMPQTRVRLSAGRLQLSEPTQTLCFLARCRFDFSWRPALDDTQSRSRRRPVPAQAVGSAQPQGANRILAVRLLAGALRSFGGICLVIGIPGIPFSASAQVVGGPRPQPTAPTCVRLFDRVSHSDRCQTSQRRRRRFPI